MEQINDENEFQPQNSGLKKDKSLLYMGIILGTIIMVMGYLTLFVDDPWKIFRGDDKPITVIDDNSKLLEKTEEMSDEQVRKSLIKFIEAFYFDQRRGYFDPPSYFAPITETFYNFHNLTYERLKNLYWKRKADMENLKSNWIVSSLDFQRVGQRIEATYWVKESYLRPSKNQLESGDFQVQMTIDENGKIVSLMELNQRNFDATPIQAEPDSLVDSSQVVQPSAPVSTPPVTVPSEPAATNAASNVVDNKVYNLGSVEAAPEFDGGQRKLARFVRKNLNRNVGVTGEKVFVGFTVEKNGQLKDIHVVRGVGGGADEEALRVVRSSPSWNPGTIGGKPVRVSYVLPIEF
ncbi:hypothetical protein GS399_02370 [Pedobacter sp. HMF7647]|uniref:TonB C-terminal domain-containing protein n=1 Tax=Hufsiella arboris TaxID=2695275 RepID=A0A7K1Y6P9_9SPHI|nr:energy transducer TonB [Hufsiella arboris]MXV49799.1 hypothetical protein [Hufsiella arboris]